MDGVSYDDDELETLEAPESCCQPFAADSLLAISNCHMLQFLAELGPQCARKDSGLAHQLGGRLGSGGATPGGCGIEPKASDKFPGVFAWMSHALGPGTRVSPGQGAVGPTPLPVPDPHQKGKFGIASCVLLLPR